MSPSLRMKTANTDASRWWSGCPVEISACEPATGTRQVPMRTPSNQWGPLPPHAVAAPPPRPWRWLERVLLVMATLSLGYYAYVTGEAYLYQAYETRELDAILRSAPVP